MRIASKLAYHMPTWLPERTARFDADADPFWALCISDCSSVPEFGERKRTGVCCEKGNTMMMMMMMIMMMMMMMGAPLQSI